LWPSGFRPLTESASQEVHSIELTRLLMPEP
jgi:hypothetical protein